MFSKSLFLSSVCLILSQATNLDSSKLKELADNNFKHDEYSRRLSNEVENTVGKGEIARYEQFLLLSRSFQRTCTSDT